MKNKAYEIKTSKFSDQEQNEFQNFCLDKFSFDYLKYQEKKNLIFTNAIN